MAKDIIMQVLTSAGYEPMYPFNPKLVLTGNFLQTSTNKAYNIQITGLNTPITNTSGNSMGIISFIPTISNADNTTLSINGDTARPIVFSDGANVKANSLVEGRQIFVKYYNDKFYLILDKNQIGLGNVNNIAPEDMPISKAMQTALDNKVSMPIEIPRNANLNNYTTAGFYLCQLTSTADTIANVPSHVAFSLLVEKHNATKQTFTSYETGGIKMWVRNLYANKWGDWYQVAFVLTGTKDPDRSMGLNGNIYIKYE